jgi:hypothetical protein
VETILEDGRGVEEYEEADVSNDGFELSQISGY